MKISEELIPLIKSGEKLYQFFNKKIEECICEFGGEKYALVYENGVPFELTCYYNKNWGLQFSFCDCEITKQEFKWIFENLNYFINFEKLSNYVYIYRWKKLKIEEVEGV